eukprot:3549239-Alexandrium_andersonii.AAC.1
MRSSMLASPTPVLHLGSTSWSPAAARSNTATPRPTLPCARRGTGRLPWHAGPQRRAGSPRRARAGR